MKITGEAVLRALFVFLLAGSTEADAQAKKPNIVYFLVDNLGMGELSSYSGGPFRGVTTARIDAFANEAHELRSGGAVYAVPLRADDRTLLRSIG